MAKWYIKRNDKQAGPFESAQLKQLATGGKIKPEDLLRREDQDVWHKAESVRGLFAPQKQEETKPQEASFHKASDPPPPITPTAASDPATSLPKTLQSGANSLWNATKRTGQVAAKKAEITKITQLSLPAAYHALGEAYYNQHMGDSNAEESQIAEVTALKSETKLEKEILEKLPSNTVAEKAKFIAAQAASLAKGKIAEQKIKMCMQSLGESVYAKGANEPELMTYKEQIQSLIKRNAELSKEIEKLRATPPNSLIDDKKARKQSIQPDSIGRKKTIRSRKKALLVGAACLLLTIISTTVSKMGGTIVSISSDVVKLFELEDSDLAAVDPQNQSFEELVQRKQTDEVNQGGSPNETTQNSVTDEGNQNGTTDITMQYNMPDEITQQKMWPELALAKIPVEVRTNPNLNVSEPFVSPRGRFIAFVLGRDKPLNMRLWNAEDGSEVDAKSDECDYFSLPAIFSPDETRMACLDGEFVRVWNIKTNTASLSQSIRLPKLSNTRDEWNAINWGKEDTIMVGVRAENQRRFTYLRLRQSNAAFAIDGTERSSPKMYKEALIRFSSFVVSPDGNTAVLAVRDNERGQLTIQLSDFNSGREIREVSLPGFPEEALIRFPQASTVIEKRPDIDYYSGDCLGFSPDGLFLLVSFFNAHVDAADKTKKLRVISTRDWGKSAELDLEGLVGKSKIAEDSAGGFGYRCHCFSPDGKSVAGIAIQESSTSRGTKAKRVAVVHDLSTGKRTAQIDLGDEFDAKTGTHLSSFNYRIAGEFVRFSPDGSKLVIAIANDNGWNEKERQPETSWSVGEWNVSDKRRLFAISGVTRQVSSITLTPDGKCLFLGTSQVLDVPQLAKLRAVLDEGDRYWDQGNHLNALKSYCVALNDDRAGIVYGNMRRAWSRCIDAFAENNRIAESKALVLHMQESGMDIEPETTQGKQAVSELLADQKAAKQRAAELAMKVAESQLKELRAKNQSNRVIAATVTKREFVNRLRSTATRGRIEVSAIFECFAFQDVFGDPDSNVDWGDGKRLYLYRCSDGAVQLEVRVIGSRVFLTGFSEF